MQEHGYVCKQCGGPSPMGIGYVDNRPGAGHVSSYVTRCPCGHSRVKAQRARVPHDLLTVAVRELAELLPHLDSREPVEVSTGLLDGIADLLGEDLGCDHAVNICTCGIESIVAELRLAVVGMHLCTLCGGDGIDFDVESGKCPSCNGSGSVPSGL